MDLELSPLNYLPCTRDLLPFLLPPLSSLCSAPESRRSHSEDSVLYLPSPVFLVFLFSFSITFFWVVCFRAILSGAQGSLLAKLCRAGDLTGWVTCKTSKLHPCCPFSLARLLLVHLHAPWTPTCLLPRRGCSVWRSRGCFLAHSRTSWNLKLSQTLLGRKGGLGRGKGEPAPVMGVSRRPAARCCGAPWGPAWHGSVPTSSSGGVPSPEVSFGLQRPAQAWPRGGRRRGRGRVDRPPRGPPAPSQAPPAAGALKSQSGK